MSGVRHPWWHCAGQNLPLLTGNVVSLGLSLLITVVGSLIIRGRDFDWKTLNKITKTEDAVSFSCFHMHTPLNMTLELFFQASLESCRLLEKSTWSAHC